MPSDQSLLVEANDDLGASHFRLRLRAPDGDGTTRPPSLWEPGQFAMISVGQPQGSSDPLLRRPFSIFNLPERPEGAIEIFYKVLGRGTTALSRVRPSDRLKVLWPLGNGFRPERPAGSRLLLVAGGIGSASLHPLGLQEMRAGGSPLMLYGCRTAADLAGIQPTREAGIECLVATDDGTAGRRGFASDLLDDFLAKEGPTAGEKWVICSCGPTPMMKATAAVAKRHGVRCYLSLESPMACGFGVCVGCVIGTRAEPGAPLRYLRTCVEGPVFDAAEICW